LRRLATPGLRARGLLSFGVVCPVIQRTLVISTMLGPPRAASSLLSSNTHYPFWADAVMQYLISLRVKSDLLEAAKGVRGPIVMT
jgi:hypothetical protein